MKQHTTIIFFLVFMLLLGVSCSGSDESPTVDTSDLSMVELVLQLPQNTSTRVSDPGEVVDESEDWDRLALIFVYTDASTEGRSNKVATDILSKADLEALQNYGNSKTIKQYKVLLPKGDVYIYGVTYSHDAANNPENLIQTCTTKADVEALSISSQYASSDDASASTSKVLSVATGFYQGAKVANDGKTEESNVAVPQTITIPQKQNELLKNLPLMTLSRLATEIDVQWDAKNAFSTSNANIPYHALSVDGFEYHGGVGRLFPTLCAFSASGTVALPTIGTNYVYANTDAISKRNGRAYFYVFPDGITPSATETLNSAYISFKITSQKTAEETEKTTTYNFKFKDKLLQATWYKVNTKIKGNSQDNETTVLVGK